MKTRKKGVILIVEGVNEQVALGGILQRLADELNLRISVVNGDVTADYGSDPSTIRRKLGDLVKKEMQRSSFRKEDVACVLQLMDTDGAFVPSSAIIERPTENETRKRRGGDQERSFQYTEKNIYAKSREKVEERNTCKARNMMLLRGMRETCGICYAAFYMSRNMEHVIADEGGNLTPEAKDRIAEQFNDMFEEDLPMFKKFINESAIAKFDTKTGDFWQRYNQSWEYMEQKNSLRSLERASNLCLLVEILEKAGKGEELWKRSS